MKLRTSLDSTQSKVEANRSRVFVHNKNYSRWDNYLHVNIRYPGIPGVSSTCTNTGIYKYDQARGLCTLSTDCWGIKSFLSLRYDLCNFLHTNNNLTGVNNKNYNNSKFEKLEKIANCVITFSSPLWLRPDRIYSPS